MFPRFVRTLATSTPPTFQDVVIIGGGPAGLTLLTALKTSPKTKHLKCTLVEGFSLDNVRKFHTEPPSDFTNRVVSVTPKSIEFMQNKIGSWDFIHEDRVKLYDGIIAYDSQDSDSRVEFDVTAIGKGVLAAMIEVINIQSSLLAKVESLQDEATTIKDNTKVVEIINPAEPDLDNHDLNEIDTKSGDSNLDWPIVKLSNGESIQTRLLVGADGYNSPVRKYAHIESRGWQYNRFGVVATVKMQYEDFRSVGWQRFLTTGPLAILPLTEDNATIVWSSTPELAEILLKVNDKIFPQLVTAAMVLDEVDLNYIYSVLEENPDDFSVLQDIEWRLSKINAQELEEKYPVPVVEVLPGSRARFPLKMSHADTYVAPRVALIGDAAHTIHPLAGQGLNMGQSDVAALVEALEKGMDRGMDIGSTLVLESYVADAWPSNHAMLGVCDKLHKVFSTDFYPLVWARGIINLDKKADKASRIIKSDFAKLKDHYNAPKYPIVLCHGFSGFDRLALFPLPKILDNNKQYTEKSLIELDYWYGIKDALEKLGSTVFIAKVPAFGDIKSRAISLDKFIEKKCKKLRKEESESSIYNDKNQDSTTTFQNQDEPIKVNLISHSMGGLDSRYLISKIHKDSEHYKVASLTTISTPHHGSECADFVVDMIGGNSVLKELCPRSIFELTTAHMRKFNEQVQDDPDFNVVGNEVSDGA
ncbi:hypothetical protein G210_2877 [Candida maltosa Xu316]|uniref:Ubiquinone biosynthesis monooxygenase COQ6, mitochondrial n=1 Tax=Candida maltosa (strain Xu316) TaxID=1245528 RepID=M3HHQ7_CANMX|nr:hypothetical protein G210_2877 [Candida maltosa Xu316]